MQLTKVIVTSKSTSICVYVESCLLQLFRFEYTAVHVVSRKFVNYTIEIIEERQPPPRRCDASKMVFCSQKLPFGG